MTGTQRRWSTTLGALVAIVFGVLTLGKPYWSLESLPILLVLAALLLFLWHGSLRQRAVLGVIVAVVVVGTAIAPDLSVALLVYGAVAYLLVRGVEQALAVGKRDWFSGLRGIGLILLGIVSAFWLDVTSILVGLIIGPSLIVIGSIALIRTWKSGSRTGEKPGRDPHPAAMVAARIGSVLLLAVALAATIATGFALSGAPKMDSFTEYSQPVGENPGRLLKAESFDRSMPDDAQAWRILYTTTGLDDEITLATGLVIVPENRSSEPMPVVLWAHGTTGIEPKCGPTLLNDPLGAGAMVFPEQPLQQGWAIVLPDYLGLGTEAPHPYLVGRPTAHSSLDAVRAARQMDQISLDAQTVVWGHSQGGGAALWIGIEAPIYAPDVPLLGVAAMSPASNLPEFIDTALLTPAGPIFGSYIILAYSNTYEDVELRHYIRPGARFSQEHLAARCLSEPSIVVSLVSALIREPFTHTDVHDGPLYTRLQQNVPELPIGVPIFLGQGESDPLILPGVQVGYVQQRCDAGEIVQFHLYEGLDHMGVVQIGSPMIADLMSWTSARFAGEPAPVSCSTTAH